MAVLDTRDWNGDLGPCIAKPGRFAKFVHECLARIVKVLGASRKLERAGDCLPIVGGKAAHENIRSTV